MVKYCTLYLYWHVPMYSNKFRTHTQHTLTEKKTLRTFQCQQRQTKKFPIISWNLPRLEVGKWNCLQIASKWICLKLVGSDIQWFAGGPRPLGKKRSLKQCRQGHLGNIWITTRLYPSQQVPKSEGWVKPTIIMNHAVSHGDSLIVQWIVLFNVLSHMNLLN